MSNDDKKIFTLECYLEMIEEDAKINKKDLLEESLKIPKLLSKYQKFFVYESKILKEALAIQDKKKLHLHKYYQGDASDDVYKDKPLNKKPLKTDIDKFYIPADDEYQELDKKIYNQKLKVDTIEAQLKNLNQRGFLLKTAVEWERFKNGLN